VLPTPIPTSPTPIPTPYPTSFTASQCGQASTNPLSTYCALYEGGWATLNHDSFQSPISLKIETKDATTDVFQEEHGRTLGSFTDETATNGRYVLACPQTEGEKTVKFTITRPPDFTRFGAEWIQLFPKDSWTNVTNEYEPFTFNSYGAKIPLNRATSTEHADDAVLSDELIVYMEVSAVGDWEVKYGNPVLSVDGKWVANEFKRTLLRVGTPWASCDGGTALGEASYSGVGAIIPALYGNPGQPATYNLYNDLIRDLTGVEVAVKVILEAFNSDIKTWTSSTNFADTPPPGGLVYTKCYRAGNPCPEGHVVCDETYCELDRWQEIIAGLQAASPGFVTVLGSVDAGTTTSEYDQLDVDGFYFSDPEVNVTSDDVADSPFSVVGIGAPLFAMDQVEAADVWVTLIEDATKLGVWTPFSWYPGQLTTRWAAVVYNVPSAEVANLVDVLFDRGYGFVYGTTEEDFTTASTATPAILAAIEAKAGVERRRLEDENGGAPPARLLEVVTDGPADAPRTYWACDDTRIECAPVCLETQGLVTNRVANGRCAGLPKDDCECAMLCYFDVRWVCAGDGRVVCTAKQGRGASKEVGDMVCTSRGAPKPSASDLDKTECKKRVTLGNWPAEVCLPPATPSPTPDEAGDEDGAVNPAAGNDDVTTQVKKKAKITVEQSMSAVFANLLLALFVVH
jgi:hypothetical protein